MNAVTITAKGQVTLRKELLRHLGVHPGDKISFDKLPGGEIKIRAIRSSGEIEAFFWSLKREGHRPISLVETNEAIENGWDVTQGKLMHTPRSTAAPIRRTIPYKGSWQKHKQQEN